ncbi:MAG: hypothetical protein ACLSGS_02400 [Adlercreutzia sp.]
MLQRDALGALFELSTVVQLRNFWMPASREDDFFFADRVVSSGHGCDGGRRNQDLFAYVRELGLDASARTRNGCELNLANVYNSLPSWENNGWSPQELLGMAGRGCSTTRGGDVMKVGATTALAAAARSTKCCGR